MAQQRQGNPKHGTQIIYDQAIRFRLSEQSPPHAIEQQEEPSEQPEKSSEFSGQRTPGSPPKLGDNLGTTWGQRARVWG